MKHFVIATAGHVDHGKSSLVKALTGTDPDRLPEEKARQITIDLGFAELNLGHDIHAALVDVPGHEDFVRNMIAGVGSIDLALFVVAADDGWMPQTEEHLQILEYLGVKQAVIALTKIDLSDAAKCQPQILDKLRDTAFADAPVVPCSVRTNLGINELRQSIALGLSQLAPQRDINKPRLPVDRAFSLHGIGTVVTGTLTGGGFHRGDTVFIQPRNVSARVRSIQSHGRDVENAAPGTRTALNLPDVTAAREIARGDVVTVAGFTSSNVIDAMVRRSARIHRAPPLKSGATVYLHHATTRTAARIILSGRKTLDAGEEALVQLRLASPIMAFVGDRFVLRDPSEQHTLAGGLVLNVRAVAGEGPRRASHQQWLSNRLFAIEDVDACVVSELALRGHAGHSELLRESHFSVDQVSNALQRLHQRQQIFLVDGLAIDLRVWESARLQAGEAIDSWHRAHPEHAGMEVSDLRASLSAVVAPVVLDRVMYDLCTRDFVRVGSTIARRSHRPSLTGPLAAVTDAIRKTLSVQPFDPPSRRQIETDELHRKALRLLTDRAEIAHLSSDVVISAEALAEMKRRIVQFISDRGAATVSQLRQELGTSRRIMVPLLELLDREKVTRREGDTRTLAKQPVTAATGAVK